ncbi:MAG: hypothetical protein KDA81_18895 [Planctomycetaceae bacterium]|nr:hypothetical protein [Planctomycetaceae bacterium]
MSDSACLKAVDPMGADQRREQLPSAKTPFIQSDAESADVDNPARPANLA